MRVRYLSILTLFTGLLSFQSMAQDPHFSQFYANPLYLNPAFAGVDKCPKVRINYRNQFPSLGIYETYSASYDQYLESVRGGVGLLVVRDNAADGVLTTTEVSGLYSYNLEVTREFSILAGFQATFRQRSLDWGSFTFPDQIDPIYGFILPTSEVPPGSNNNNHLDLSTGFIGFSERFYVGIALHHLTEPNEAFLSDNKLPMKITAHGGAAIRIGRKRLYNSLENLLIPNILYQRQGEFEQWNYGLSFNKGEITGGVALRQSSINPDAVIFLFGFTPDQAKWRLGYSYDYTISDFTNVGGGAHELSLGYQFDCRVRKRSIKAIKCPKF